VNEPAVFFILFAKVSAKIRAAHSDRNQPHGGELRLGLGYLQRCSEPAGELGHPEPFGLVLIEAMACGTPVIAFNRGSVPEIIEDGLTGFVVKDKEEAVAASDRLPRLSRDNRLRDRTVSRAASGRFGVRFLLSY
jgi:glycosyltransferase involved in cell wall biosynthesis